MDELGSSLTVTGLIATAVSVLFAAAAVYISHHKRRAHNSGAEPYSPTSSAPAMAPAAQAPHGVATVIGKHRMVAVPTNTEAMPTSGASVFRKLSARGMEDPLMNNGSNHAYVWE